MRARIVTEKEESLDWTDQGWSLSIPYRSRNCRKISEARNEPQKAHSHCFQAQKQVQLCGDGIACPRDICWFETDKIVIPNPVAIKSRDAVADLVLRRCSLKASEVCARRTAKSQILRGWVKACLVTLLSARFPAQCSKPHSKGGNEKRSRESTKDWCVRVDIFCSR